MLLILALFISIYVNVNDKLEAAACNFSSLNEVDVVCSTCVWYPCAYAACVCVFACNQWRQEWKVWAHITKLSYTSVRCNIYSSVIVNKGGNTSNIMKHLLTKHNMQCAVFTMSPGPSCNWRDIHIKCWLSGRVTLTRHCTYLQSLKYIICVCLSLKPWLNISAHDYLVILVIVRLGWYC